MDRFNPEFLINRTNGREKLHGGTVVQEWGKWPCDRVDLDDLAGGELCTGWALNCREIGSCGSWNCRFGDLVEMPW
ncbi:hypothetical protein M0R45_001089 [Rubus argutus]|uniref:Uncharacterized protein n=1 Tax=Rubus argutus TaxID=59490 RepID=A0AAW1VLN3_RUBAR